MIARACVCVCVCGWRAFEEICFYSSKFFQNQELSEKVVSRDQNFFKSESILRKLFQDFKIFPSLGIF